LDILHLNVLNKECDVLEIDSVSIFTCPLCENVLLYNLFANILIKTRVALNAVTLFSVQFRQGKWMLPTSQLY